MKLVVGLAWILGATAILGLIGAVYLIKSNSTKQNNTSLISTRLTPSPTPPPDTLLVLIGSANLQRGTDKKTITKDATQPLTAGDIITTDANALATIDYHEDSLVRIGPNAKVVYQRNLGTKATLLQSLGSLYVRFKKILGVREEFSLETPTALATVRGTTFASFVSANKTSKIAALDNPVDVYKLDESTKSSLLQTKKTIEKNSQALVASLPGGIIDPATAIRVSPASLTIEESAWIQFNMKVDEAGLDFSRISSLSSQFFVTPTPASTPVPTKPPITYSTSMSGEGYSRSTVKTDAGDFPITCIGANKNSTRVVTDSANESDCKDNCPVLPLADYATRNGGFAAMNGMYFCPADYASCAGKVNTFDTLFFNSRVKAYINSDNNKYSVIPFLAVDAGSNPIFKHKTLEWGRDTGIQAGTAGNPLLIAGGGNVVGEYSLDDKQRNVKSNRGAFVQKGDTIFLCVVGGATVPDSASVYQKLGVDNAINIDGGGSSALWVNGSYIYGPGRNIPTAIIFTRK